MSNPRARSPDRLRPVFRRGQCFRSSSVRCCGCKPSCRNTALDFAPSPVTCPSRLARGLSRTLGRIRPLPCVFVRALLTRPPHILMKRSSDLPSLRASGSVRYQFDQRQPWCVQSNIHTGTRESRTAGTARARCVIDMTTRASDDALCGCAQFSCSSRASTPRSKDRPSGVFIGWGRHARSRSLGSYARPQSRSGSSTFCTAIAAQRMAAAPPPT